MNDNLKFPGTLPPGSGDVYDDGFDVFEDWEAHEEFLKNEDYPELVELCEREVTRHPEDLQAQECLGEAYVLNGQYQKAIETMGEVHRKFPCNPAHYLAPLRHIA